MAVAEGLPLPREPGEPLGRPVDLEYEMDRWEEGFSRLSHWACHRGC